MRGCAVCLIWEALHPSVGERSINLVLSDNQLPVKVTKENPPRAIFSP